MSALEVGHLVALLGEDVNNKPLIGKCIRIMEEEIEVVWLDGSYTTSWRPSKRPDPQTRKSIDWTDVVLKSSIILYDFCLTAAGHLRKATIRHLKEAYSRTV